MPAVSVVTSFSALGYEKYGRRCLETFHANCPKEWQLHIISEDKIDSFPVFEGRRVLTYNLYEESFRAKTFYLLYGQKLEVSGRGKIGSDKRRNRHWRTGYSFRHDALKFSKKVFALHIAERNTSGGRLIWLDADTVVKRPIQLDLVNQLNPPGYAISYFDRSPYHSECGFVIYNLDVIGTRKFIEDFANLYYSGRVFELWEWHDSWVFDWLRKQSGLQCYAIPHKKSGEPIRDSVLGEYLDHLKGNRKNVAYQSG